MDDLTERIAESVREKIEEILPKPDPQEKYLTRKETAELLRISLVTLGEWGKKEKGYLKPRKIGSRVRFLKSEIDELMKQGTHKKYCRS
ncbi:MAG: helix-turn-helix domain-containing protein [Bacteroidetes bacterium]|nr:helix-turn-helix domain-containing protein [Bacteroidota bacterium]